jgi:hypothetical protein
VRAEPEVDFQTAAAIGLRGLECHAALLSTLTPRQVFDLLGWSPKLLNDPHRVALA